MQTLSDLAKKNSGLIKSQEKPKTTSKTEERMSTSSIKKALSELFSSYKPVASVKKAVKIMSNDKPTVTRQNLAANKAQ